MKSLSTFSSILLLVVADALLCDALQLPTSQAKSLRRNENLRNVLYLVENPMDESDKSGGAERLGPASRIPSGPAPEGGWSNPWPQPSGDIPYDSHSTKNEKVDDLGTLVAQSSHRSNLDADKILSNFLGGNVGQRGEAWSVASILLLGLIFVGSTPLPYMDSLLTLIAGPGLILAGISLILVSTSGLGSNNLTPFLSPTSKSSLATAGIYSKIRHPMYSGLIALCTGFSVATQDATRLLLTAFLIFLLNIKAEKEEEMLLEKFPQYADYRATTGKFVPGDWSFRE